MIKKINSSALMKIAYFLCMFIYIITFDERNSPLASINSRINIKYVILFLSILFILFLSFKKIIKCPLSKFNFWHSFKCVIFLLLGFTVITISLSLINIENFEISYIKFYILNILYIFVPYIFVFLYYNLDYNIDFDYYFNVILFSSIVNFIICFGDIFTIKNIFSINFIDSYSPYESDVPVFLIFVLFYYIYRKKYFLSFLSFVIIFLSFKRIELIAAFMLLPLLFVKTEKLDIRLDKKVIIVSIFVFTILPMIICKITQNEVIYKFYTEYGVDLYSLTTGRTGLIGKVVNDANYISLGLGMTEYWTGDNIHSDLAKIYLECGILGSLLLTCSFFNISKKCSLYSYFVLIYLFIHFAGTHSLDMFHVNICFFLLILFFEYKSEHKKEMTI